MSVALVAAVERAIAQAEVASPGAGESWEAELARSVAADVAGASSLSAKVAAGKLLTETLGRLGVSTAAPAAKPDAPVEVGGDRLDALARKRRKRIAAA
ncbi:MAG: hypothetical protein AB7O78_01770 [Thermoleophilia bacterium]